MEKELKALENRMYLKLSNAVEKIGDVIKKQDRRMRGFIGDANESRIILHSSISPKSGRK